jgi:asparagine synthase (glutamine-hydrolysing)
MPELRLRNRSEYVEAFRDVFDRAVRDRVPGEGSVGSMLSGGLDSGSVTVTAARCVAERGHRLTAFTSTPVFEGADSDPKGRFGNELPLARASADAAGNVDLSAIDSAGLSPVGGIRKTLEVAFDPQHAAANLFWMLEINRAAAAGGCKVLLTGQLGNAGISWPGDPFSHSMGLRIRRMGWRRWLRNSGRRLILNGAVLRIAEKHFRQKALAQTAIRPEFARRLRLIDRWAEENAREAAPHAPRTARRRIILNGLASVNALFAEMGVAEGLVIRDPTGDPQLVAFCLSVPDRIFMDPETGLDRWLIREAMKGLLPDEVRLNRQRGFQAADLLQRLRAAPAEMEQAISEIERGRAADYLDVPGLRKVWERVRLVPEGDVHETRFLASVVLMRGVMAGLSVNRFG